MCDTSVAVGSATVDGSVIFAKNSDRPANECQPLRYYPAQVYPAGARLPCTHREIPQVRDTFAVLGSQPWWIWGFEMGINERGVVIGNEAVYGREGYAADGLLGMDLLRLGLERGATAQGALQVMVGLLEEFGQGGSADYFTPRSYHNSYIIADPTDAWVLETIGRYWAAERVRGRRAISNCLTIGASWDAASPDLIDHAVANGWWDPARDFNFALAYGDPDRDTTSGVCRFARATDALGGPARLGVPDLMAVLRDHAGVRTSPEGDRLPTPICMHESPPNVGATAASLVAHLRPNLRDPRGALVWHSFGSPCLGGFHPLYPLAGPPPASLALGGRTFDPASPWWLNERVQRRADAYPSLKGLVQATWADAERGSFAAVAAAERRAALLPASEASAVLRAVGEERAVSLLATLGELDDLTARQVPDLAGPSPADRAHWASLNEPVGLVLEAQLVS